MAIIIRTFSPWAHVSAESTNSAFRVYLSAGSRQNQKKFLKDYEKYMDKFKFSFPYQSNRRLVIQVTIANKKIYLKVDRIGEDGTCVVNYHDALSKLGGILTDKNEIEAIANLLSFYKFNITNVKNPTMKANISYHSIEQSPKPDKITLPTIQDGFAHGLDEKKFYETTCSLEDNFNIRKNNCADYVITTLKKAGADNFLNQKINKILSHSHIGLGFFRIRNPNIRLLSQTVVDYVKALRESILLKTINDDKLAIRSKLIDVLRLEKQRLEDEAYNIENTLVKKFRMSYAKRKQRKANLLDDAISKLITEEPNVEECKILLQNLLYTRDLGKGLGKTRQHLQLLQQQIGQPVHGNTAQQQFRLKQYEKQLMAQQKRRKWLTIAAIVFVPSLLVTLPIWFIAKHLEPIKELKVTEKTSQKVNKRRKKIKKDLPIAPTSDGKTKPKKVILFKNKENTVYLVDKAQLSRFKFFANHKTAYLKKHKNEVVKNLNKSISKSKKSF